MEEQASPSSLLLKKAPRRCQPAALRSRVYYSNQTTGRFKQTWTKKLQFPDIVQRYLRQDIVIQAPATKRFVIVELTVYWEERCRSTYEMKKAHTKVHIPTNSVQRAWLANLVVPSRGVLSEFSSTIKMYHIELPRHVEGKQHTDAVKALGWVVECVPYSFTQWSCC